jgi:glycosyltransferase involved in cell wall biosynthesis
MRIAMVSEHASPLAALGGVDAGGQNLHVAELSAALVRAGNEVSVYTRRDKARLPQRVDAPGGVEVVHVPAGPAKPVPKDELLPYMEKFADFLADDWTAQAPDLVHGHFWMSGLAAVRAAATVDIPVVQTFHALGTVKRRHQGAMDTSPAERIDTEIMVAQRATCIAATCTDELVELGRMGIARDRAAIVPCGVNTEQFHPEVRPDSRSRRHRVVSVGRLVPRKGFDLLIQALPGLPDTELLIAGGPAAGQLGKDAEARRLREAAEKYGVCDRVRLLGQVPRDRMPALIRSADVVACTPWYEPFGIVPLEAMACGVPVVATAVGGMLDTVVDGMTGMHVPPRDPRSLQSALRLLLNDRFRREAFGAAGRDRAVARYSWDRVATETSWVYETVMASLPTAVR